MFDNIHSCGDFMESKKFEDRNYIKNMYSEVKKLFNKKNKEPFLRAATEYLILVPDDMLVRLLRANVYRNYKRFDDAISDLKYIIDPINKVNLRFDDKSELGKQAFMELFYINYYLNNYNELLEMIPIVYETRCMTPYSVSICELVIKTNLKMGISVKKDMRNEYVKSQIINYNSENALNHIKDHLICDGIKSHTCFSEGINLEYLLQIVRSNLKRYERANINDTLQVNYFSIPNVGTSELGPCNFIKVISIPNTNNVVNIYPLLNQEYEEIPYLECDYDKLFNKKIENEESQEKVKTKSQIDKFNKRFKRI